MSNKITGILSGGPNTMIILVICVVAALGIGAIAASGILNNNEPTNDTDGTKYTVSFDPRNGDDPATIEVEKGQPSPVPKVIPLLQGQTFLGWYTAASGGTLWDFNTLIEENVVLYAQWGTFYITQGTAIAKTYGNPAFTLTTSGGEGPGAVTWSSNNACISIDNTGKATITGAGTAVITATKAAGGGHGSVTAQTTITVAKATLTVTADNKSMNAGGSVPALTFRYSGFVYGDTAASLTAVPSVSTTATSSSPANTTYPIVVSGGASSNYSFSYVNGTMTVSPPSAATTIIVKHVRSSDGFILLEDTHTVTPGSYAYGSTFFHYYDYDGLAPGSAPASGTIQAGQTITIVHHYTKQFATVIVKHICGQMILEENSYEVTPGGYGPYLSKNFEGFVYDKIAPGSAPASGTIQTGETRTITYEYLPV